MTIESRYLTLTQANLDHGHMYLTTCMDMFPIDALGGSNRSQAASRTVRVQCGSEVVDTDIDREKRFFRQRGWVRRFFSESHMVAGDRVLLERLAPYSYRVSKAEIQEVFVPLICLSIQQPWADLILDGKKFVENRSRTWKDAVRNLDAEANVLLGIHASSGTSTWRKLTEKQRDDYAPGWCVGDSRVREVLGVVDLVQICRSSDLPPLLRKHKFTIDKPDNWCWVLRNPRKLVEPIQAKGNTWLFYVDVPRDLLPEDLRS